MEVRRMRGSVDDEVRVWTTVVELGVAELERLANPSAVQIVDVKGALINVVHYYIDYI